MTALSRIRWALLTLLAVLIVGVTGRRLLTGGTWLEAFYYFVITVSGVGYTERSTLPPELQLFSIFLILIGMFVVGYTITLLLQLMIEGQIYRALGVRRMTQDIDHLDGHTVICGFGRMGKTLAEEFARRGVSYVVIDHDADVAIAARAEGQLVVTGDAMEEETLIAAGVKRAQTLVASLESDADNVFLTLTARNLSGDLRIIARGELPATEQKLRQAGANEVVLPAVIGARRMAALVTRPHAAHMIDLVTDHRTLDAELEEFTIGADCNLVGQSIREVALREKYHVMIIAIRRQDGKMLFNPDASTPFAAGDTTIMMGKQSELQAFQTANGL